MLFFAREKGKAQGGAFYVQEVPAGAPRRVSAGYGSVGRPVSPDGKWIVSFGADWKQDLLLTPIEGGTRRTIPNTNTLDPVRWTLDGKSILAVEVGSLPARIFRVDVATGRRELWKELGPADLAGVIDISGVHITPDEKSYVYGSSKAVTSDLYIVGGLR